MFTKKIRWINSILAAFILIGCGGSKGTAQKEEDVGIIVQAPNYINLSPSDRQVLATENPIFKFERDINGASSSTLCDSRHEAKYKTQVKVIKIDPQTADTTVVVDEVIFVANECQFEVQFPSLTLEENVGYAWRVGEPNEVENSQTVWNSFVYSSLYIGEEKSNPHACENNMVKDWTFTDSTNRWMTSDITNTPSSLPAIRIQQGHDDNNSVSLTTPHSLIYQTLTQPIEQGKYYQLKFSLKHQGKTDFQIKALAFNGSLDDLQPDANTSVIAITGTMIYTGDWIKVTLNPWKANKNFSNLAIVLFNEDNTTINALIDRVCLTETTGGGCGEEVALATNIPEGFDMNNSNPIVTNFEYLAGTVNDLYPNADTSNSEWFLEGNSTTLECTTVGEDAYTDEEVVEFTEQDSNNSAIEQLHNDIDNWIADNNDVSQYENNDTNLTPITPLNADKCTDRIVDYSKPFSGRDIVYVHGLQKDAIDDLKRFPWRQKHTGRWPFHPAAFTSQGSYYSVAKPYWEDHIRQTLGSTTNPSNSYMIVTWSALQRAKTGINAILHEIRDARAGNHDLVTMSANAKAHNQCFGDNGIVFVTHSTGGMLISMMFGQMERHKNDPQYINYVDPTLSDLFDAQVAFDAAFRGSDVATAGLMSTHSALYPDEAIRSVLVDLGVPVVTAINNQIMNDSEKPTFMLIGAEAGINLGGENTNGRIFLRGYNDTVVTSWSQAAHLDIEPRYAMKLLKQTKLLDKGASVHKAVHMVRKGTHVAFPFTTRRYYVSAAFSPSGMLQDSVFNGYIHPRAYLKNHYPIIQTTGDHYDNVNFINRNGGRDYYRPTITNENNNEETSVVIDDSLYTNGYLGNSFRTLQDAWIKKRTWGFHFVKITFVKKTFLGGSYRIPKFTWHYYEFIKWKRTYHLLHDYKTKNGADYMYQYLLRP